jgi:hypothetical protein
MFRSQLTRSARSVVEPAGPAEPAGASARGARARCAYGAADSFRSAHILLLEVPEDADRPAQGRQRPSRTCTDWPPCRCHRDHLIVVSGLAIRPCLLDRPPMRSGDVRAMEDGWICRAHPRMIRVTSGSTAGRQGWRTQLPPTPGPGYPSPATAAAPARSAAAGEQAIADHRESGPEDQPRGQHQQVGRGHPASITCCPVCQP